MRSVARLLLKAWVLSIGVMGAASAAAPSMSVEVLEQDSPADALPAAASAVSGIASGERVQLLLPYRDHGTWLRVRLDSLPPEPRLVVNGVAMGRIVLVLPDGRRIERSKAAGAADPDASPVASVFALPPGFAPGAVVWLHSADHHRNLVELRLIAASDWRQRERVVLGFAIGLYGAMAAFLVIAASYWVILRERMFADHALYLAALLIFMAMSSGLFYAAFPDGLLARLGIHAQWGFATAAIGFAVGFATRFIDVGRHWARIARALDALRIGLIVLALGITLSPWAVPYFGAAMALALVAINFTLVALGVLVALRRNRYARYFLLGWIPLTVCTDVRALQGTGLVQIGYEMSFLYALGAIWEALVLTAGIADRALSFRRERDVAQHLARHDGLTGVLNRRAAQAKLDESFERSRRDAVPLAVCFLDLDHFKSINDRFGHAAGDAVLVAVSRRIAGELRADDVLGRWGGEEFVVILPSAAPAAVRAAAERIRATVEAEPVHVDGHLIPVTVSVGVAMVAPQTASGIELVRCADEALYRAKGNGRNRVEEAFAA
jgi:diguanylate cyclase (GGDEF)-like protein